MKASQLILGIIVVFAVLLGLSWLAQGNDWFMYKVWAPKYEAVRRETLEQSKSYRAGTMQRLDTLCSQVRTADAHGKVMLNDQIVHEFADVRDTDIANTYSRQCLLDARAAN